MPDFPLFLAQSRLPRAVAAPSGGGGTLMGWNLNPTTNVGLAALGVNGSTLPTYAVDVPPANTTIFRKKITTGLDLSNGGIILDQCLIQPTPTGSLGFYGVVQTINFGGSPWAAPPNPCIIRDCEIDGSLISTGTIAQICGFAGIADVIRTYVHGVGSGIAIRAPGAVYDTNIKGNYVTNLRGVNGVSHNEAFTIREFPTATTPTRQATVQGNYFDCSSGASSASTFIQGNSDFINNVTLQDNFMMTDAFYTLALEANTYGYGTNMNFYNNRLVSGASGYGYVDRGALSYSWNGWSENYANDAGQPDNKGAVVPIM